MPVEWVFCGKEERLPNPELLAEALAASATEAKSAVVTEDEVTMSLAFERCRGVLSFRRAPEGLPSPSEDLPAAIVEALRTARLAARLVVELPRSRERHGVLWALRIANVLTDHLEGPVLDVHARRAWSRDELKSKLVGRAFAVRNHVSFDASHDEKGRVWLKTQGLRALGQPELLLPGVREEHRSVAEALLELVADQEIGRAELQPGARRALRAASFAFVRAEEVYERLGRSSGEAPDGLVLVPAEAGAGATPADVDRLMFVLSLER
jgi:hypothetical protein